MNWEEHKNDGQESIPGCSQSGGGCDLKAKKVPLAQHCQ